MKRLMPLVYPLLVLILGAAAVGYAASSIDTTQPVANAAPISSTPIRGNFAAAASDISALQATEATHVVGPASATTNSIPTFSGTSGKLVQAGSGCTIIAGQVACGSAFITNASNSNAHALSARQNNTNYSLLDLRDSSGSTVSQVDAAGNFFALSGMFVSSSSSPIVQVQQNGTGDLLQLLGADSLAHFMCNADGTCHLEANGNTGIAALSVKQSGAGTIAEFRNLNGANVMRLDAGTAGFPAVTIDNSTLTTRKAIGALVSSGGPRTAASSGVWVSDTGTTSTASIPKIALTVTSTGNWSSAGGGVYGAYIDTGNSGSSSVYPLQVLGTATAHSGVGSSAFTPAGIWHIYDNQSGGDPELLIEQANAASSRPGLVIKTASSSGVPFVIENASAVTIATISARGDAVLSGVQLNPTHLSALGTDANGTIRYCDDCNKATPCTGSGTGALAKYLNGAWDCN